jgi:Skp family chaperone for outer membrane proteins
MKKLTLGLALLSIGVVSADQEPAKAPAAEKATKIGYVHIEQIFNEKAETPCHEIQDKVKSLQNELGERQKKLQDEQQKLAKEEAELKSGTKSKWTSDASRESAHEDLENRKDKWTAEARRFQEYAGRQQQKVQTEMLEKIVKTATTIGEKQGYDMILASGAMYTSKKVDITNSVVHTLNKEYDAHKAKKEAKPAAKK